MRLTSFYSEGHVRKFSKRLHKIATAGLTKLDIVKWVKGQSIPYTKIKSIWSLVNLKSKCNILY